SEVHHTTDWAAGGRTDIDNLTFACTPHHKLLDKGWQTRKQPNGQTQWIPPPHLDHGQPRTNNYHHPERMLPDRDDDDDAP
ncbi:HNH endonuclease signature motif containing protein, partial [Mycobacterium sp. 852002-51163_SCH5372311]|uniref:HNH endonuclease signature motif containing protein n=1 Tax=Mycobacterium sp. 852002-51163_SCH5372311 TaxID=1834097 RepID=UPI000A62E16D